MRLVRARLSVKRDRGIAGVLIQQPDPFLLGVGRQEHLDRHEALVDAFACTSVPSRVVCAETSFCLMATATVSSNNCSRSPLSVNRRFRFCENVE